MTRKFRTFVPGGLQKSINLPDGTSSTQGTQIAGFGGQILTIDQLKTLLGLNNPNTQTPSGGTSGGSGTASISLGEGLAGGGPLLGAVRINPVSTGQGMFAEDAPDEQMMVPGPIGQRGQQGIPGPYGPAVYLAPDEPNEDFNVVPGPPGPTGATGPQGPAGPSGGGSNAAPVWLYENDSPEEPVLMVGPRGAQGVQGTAGPTGISAPPVWIPDDTENNEPIYFGPAASAASAGGGTLANPTGLIGLTAVNGTATTGTRSDGTHALDQSIAPTWTSQHLFQGTGSATATGTSSLSIQGGTGGLITRWNASAATDAKTWRTYIDSSGTLNLGALNDAGTTEHFLLQATRSGLSIASITLGNTTDFPTITLNGAVVSPKTIAVQTAGATDANFTFGVNGVVAGAMGFNNTGGTNAYGAPTGGAYLGVAQAFPINFITSAAVRMVIGSAGDVTINTPSGGAALTVNGLAGNAQVFISSANTGGNADLQVQRTGAGTADTLLSGANVLLLNIASGNPGTVLQNSGGQTEFWQENGGSWNQILKILTTRGVQINAPASGTSLQVNQLNTGVPGMRVTGSSGGWGYLSLQDGQTGAAEWFVVSGYANAGIPGVFSIYGGTTPLSRFAIQPGGALQGYGPVAATLVDMTPDAGSFTGTFTGMTTTVTTTCHWSRNGNQVTLEFDASTGTSTANTFTMTGLPAAIQSARTQLVAAPEGGLTTSVGGLAIQTAVQLTAASGTVTFWNGGSATGWTNTGTKGVANAFSVTFLIN